VPTLGHCLNAKTLGSHYTDLDRATKVLALMLEGMSIRAIARTLEIDKNTVMSLMVSAGERVQALFDSRVRAIPAAAISLYMAWYNFCRVHSSLRVTPAMQAGLTDHVWSLAELLSA
jgi:hypothetical protein